MAFLSPLTCVAIIESLAPADCHAIFMQTTYISTAHGYQGESLIRRQIPASVLLATPAHRDTILT